MNTATAEAAEQRAKNIAETKRRPRVKKGAEPQASTTDTAASA